MIRKAIEILKMRWPEVVLVVVLQAALMIFSDELMTMSETMTQSENAQIPFWSSFLLGVGSVLFVTVWMMLYLGFMKTAAIEGVNPQQPMDLVRFGRPYFWRMLLFQIVFGFLFLVFSSVMIGIVGGFIWGTDNPSQIPPWFSQVCALAAIVLLVKPMLFIPARMIVFDNSVMQAVFAVRQYRISDISQLFRLIIGGIGVIIVLTVLNGLAAEKTPLYYILSGVHHVVFSLVFLLLTLTVVLWIQRHLEAERGQSREGQSQE